MKAINIENQKEYIETVKKLNEDKNVKYSILTMGCQLNENDSEKLSGMIEEMGYTRTENIEEADLIVFNTCCVRENADDGRYYHYYRYIDPDFTVCQAE